MIDKLTNKQEQELKEWREKFLEIGLSTEPANRPRAEKAIVGLYKTLAKKTPRFVWVASPFAAENMINEVFGNKKTQFNGTSFCGQQDAYWIAFYQFCEHIGVQYKKSDSKTLDLWSEIAKSCGWFYPYEKAVIVCERPEEIHMLADRRTLHREGGMAVKFRDGWGIWRLNGIAVPRYIAETPSADLDTKSVMAETNADVRREGLARISNEKKIRDLGATILHHEKLGDEPWLDVEILNVDFKDGKTRHVFKALDPASGRHIFERVDEKDPQCSTARGCAGWRDKERNFIKPSVRT